MKLNYKDDSYFIRLFKKYTKQTPEQFRAAQYGGNGRRCC
ncbi:AraC family transcriptional regulator [Wenyingzhuangia sp. IMCC45574]